MSHENIMRLWNDASLGGRLRPKLRIVVKTSSYTLTPDDFGTVFTTRGATDTVTFTLPAAGSTNKGEVVLFVNVADQNMIVAGADEGLVVFNDLTADNISYEASGEKIGGMFLAISDGTSWIVLPIATETQTVNVNTTATATATSTATGTSTSTATGSSTSTSTPTRTSTSTSSATTSNTATDSPTITPSSSASKSASATSTGTATKTATSTKSATSTATQTSTSTATPTATP